LPQPNPARSKPRIAIIGGGIAGLTAAWQLAQIDPTLDVTLFEASRRLGGTVETLHRDNFVIECGPDGWVTEKPWARDLAIELGLADHIIPSNDATRVTYILRHNTLTPMPDGMRMMVPTNLAALDQSPLFTEAAKAAYAAEPARAAELIASAPEHDESVADFVERHFGSEVLHTIAAPLLSGVFGGDVFKLSVRAVMPAFVRMEHTHGSLILALQARAATTPQPIFTTLSCGLGALVDRMSAAIPTRWLRLSTPISQVEYIGTQWQVDTPSESLKFTEVILATPAHATRNLLNHSDFTHYLPKEESSAVIVALAFTQPLTLPPGFGFLVPSNEDNSLLAATFMEQKFLGKIPANAHLLRAFFGGPEAPAISQLSDDAIATRARHELEKILGPLPIQAFSIIRRWPSSLPQYEVGHVDRMAKLDHLLADFPNLHLLGNAYHGVGLPDLIRDARATAGAIASPPTKLSS
jgi:oxygen-dependent protoporphyrinogen oxidase